MPVAPHGVNLLRGQLEGASIIGMDREGGAFHIRVPSATLEVLSPWRIEFKEAVVGSGDDDVTEAFGALTGRTIRHVSIGPPWHDLDIELDGGWHIRTFGETFDYEHWRCYGSGGDLTIAGPGPGEAYFPPGSMPGFTA